MTILMLVAFLLGESAKTQGKLDFQAYSAAAIYTLQEANDQELLFRLESEQCVLRGELAETRLLVYERKINAREATKRDISTAQKFQYQINALVGDGKRYRQLLNRELVRQGRGKKVSPLIAKTKSIKEAIADLGDDATKTFGPERKPYKRTTVRGKGGYLPKDFTTQKLLEDWSAYQAELTEYRLTHLSPVPMAERAIGCRHKSYILEQMANSAGVTLSDNTKSNFAKKRQIHDPKSGILFGTVKRAIDINSFELQPKHGATCVVHLTGVSDSDTMKRALTSSLVGKVVRCRVDVRNQKNLKKQTPARGYIAWVSLATDSTNLQPVNRAFR